MSNMIRFEEVEKRILFIREQQVLIDKDVAELYGVETKEINQAVRRNPEKFPESYIISLTQEECDFSRSQIVTLNDSGRGHNIKYLPKAFTEKGLYMLATILKSPTATQTTLAIVETFAKIREFARTVTELPDIKEETEKTAIMQKSSDLFLDILEDNIMEVTGDEISLELVLPVLKVKRTVKRKKRKHDGSGHK